MSVSVPQARADAEKSGFLITPFFQEISVAEHQESVPFSIDVRNNTGSPAVFRISVLDFGTLDESGGVAFLGSSNDLKYSLASWVSLSNDTLVLEPGESGSVLGAIENKESLSPGGHYGAVFFRIEDGTRELGRDPVAFDPSFASLLFVRKIGGEVYGLDLKDIGFSPSVFSLPEKVRFRFQNTGNVHVTPRGVAEVTDPMGRKIAKSIINEESGIILPETFRNFPGSFRSLSKAFIPGHYTLSTNYRFDGSDTFVAKDVRFLLIPRPFVFSLLLALLVMFWYVRFFRNKRKKDAVPKE